MIISGYSRDRSPEPSAPPPGMAWKLPLSLAPDLPSKRLMPNLRVRSDAGWMAAASRTPQVTGLIGWWDSSVFASMTFSGSTITSIADQSGGGHTMAGAGNKPIYNATGLNSRPTMEFTAASQQVFTAALFPMGTGNTLTFFTVSYMTTGTTTFGRNISYTDTAGGHTNDFNNPQSWEVERNNGAQSIRMVRNLVNTGNMAITYSTPFRLIGTVNSSGVQTIYIDGVASTTGTQAGNWGTNGDACLGSGRNESEYWNGAISEAGIATGFSDATAVAALDTYLKNKWGL